MMPKLDRGNRVTIPAAVLNAAGLRPGDDVVVASPRPGCIEISRVVDVIDEFAGCLTPGAYPPEYLASERGRWRS
jgi:bifunctional DNA-binding transcriptional regulator/antitoxin component of YhaV-PrlF toxin-antitoxin module